MLMKSQPQAAALASAQPRKKKPQWFSVNFPTVFNESSAIFELFAHIEVSREFFCHAENKAQLTRFSGTYAPLFSSVSGYHCDLMKCFCCGMWQYYFFIQIIRKTLLISATESFKELFSFIFSQNLGIFQQTHSKRYCQILLFTIWKHFQENIEICNES